MTIMPLNRYPLILTTSFNRIADRAMNRMRINISRLKFRSDIPVNFSLVYNYFNVFTLPEHYKKSENSPSTIRLMQNCLLKTNELWNKETHLTIITPFIMRQCPGNVHINGYSSGLSGALKSSLKVPPVTTRGVE